MAILYKISTTKLENKIKIYYYNNKHLTPGMGGLTIQVQENLS